MYMLRFGDDRIIGSRLGLGVEDDGMIGSSLSLKAEVGVLPFLLFFGTLFFQPLFLINAGLKGCGASSHNLFLSTLIKSSGSSFV